MQTVKPKMRCPLCLVGWVDADTSPLVPDAQALAALVAEVSAELLSIHPQWRHYHIPPLLREYLQELAAKLTAALSTYAPPESPEVTKLRAALVRNAVEFIDLGGNPLGDAAFAYRRMEYNVGAYQKAERGGR